MCGVGVSEGSVAKGLSALENLGLLYPSARSLVSTLQFASVNVLLHIHPSEIPQV